MNPKKRGNSLFKHTSTGTECKLKTNKRKLLTQVPSKKAFDELASCLSGPYPHVCTCFHVQPTFSLPSLWCFCTRNTFDTGFHEGIPSLLTKQARFRDRSLCNAIEHYKLSLTSTHTICTNDHRSVTTGNRTHKSHRSSVEPTPNPNR